MARAGAFRIAGSWLSDPRTRAVVFQALALALVVACGWFLIGNTLDNLALACYRCNKFKGPNLAAIDPRTDKLVRLFNPRRQQWNANFSRRGVLILGRTAVGRATVELLRMNAVKRQSLRREIGQ